MTKCVAKGCKNTSNKLVKMNYFPKDLDKRQKWLKNCEELGGMGHWLPNKNAALCEFHFSNEMWEERNGKMQLRKDAVPTIFGDFVLQVKISIETDKVQTANVQEDKITDQHENKVIDKSETYKDFQQNECSLSHPIRDINKIIIKPQVLPKVTDSSEITSSTENMEIMVDVHTLFVNSEKCNSIIEVSNLGLEKSYNDTEKGLSEIPAEQNDQPIENTSRNFCTANVSNHSDYSDYSDTELLNEEKDLSSMQSEFTAHCSDSDISEKFRKLEKMYLRSEKLRRLMKANHKKKERAFKNKIKQLQAKVCIIENSSKSISNIFNVEQLALLNKEYKKCQSGVIVP